MTKTLHAVFDGKVLRPEKPLELKSNTHVKITIETVEICGKKKKSFLRTARSLKLTGPPDWASHLENYLYGGKQMAVKYFVRGG